MPLANRQQTEILLYPSPLRHHVDQKSLTSMHKTTPQRVVAADGQLERDRDLTLVASLPPRRRGAESIDILQRGGPVRHKAMLVAIHAIG
jgi:hypothetical protein